MHFNTLVNSIIQESINSIDPSTIPLLDGSEEVYYVTITTSLSVYPISSCNLNTHSGWWCKHEQTKYNSYQDAMKEVIKQCRGMVWAKYSSFEPLKEIIKRVQDELHPLKDLRGTWRVLDAKGDEVDVFTKSFSIGLHIDTNYYLNTSTRQDTPFKDFDF